MKKIIASVAVATFAVLGMSSAQAAESLALYRDWETDRKSTRLNSSHRL